MGTTGAVTLPNLPSFSDPSGEETQPIDPEATAPNGMLLDMDALYKLNNDLVGFIYIKDTNVNNPVLQHKSEKDYYLYRDFYGNEDRHGSLYVREACDVFEPSDNVTIYGHNMRDGSMFALIDDYIDPAFCEAHPFFYLNTPTQNYRVDIFAGFTTDPESFVYTTAFGEESDFAAYLNTLRSLSDFSVPTELSSSDRILTLSTCTSRTKTERFTVNAILQESWENQEAY